MKASGMGSAAITIVIHIVSLFINLSDTPEYHFLSFGCITVSESTAISSVRPKYAIQRP